MNGLTLRVLSLVAQLAGLAAANDDPQTVGSVDLSDVVLPTNDTSELTAAFQLAANTSDGVKLSTTLAAMTSVSGDSTGGTEGSSELLCSGRLVLLNETSSSNDLSGQVIPLVSCDDEYATAYDLQAILAANTACTVLYSLGSEACNLTSANITLETELGTFFTLMSSSVAQAFVSRLNTTEALNYTAQILQLDTDTGTGTTHSLSSSTVAMAILYSFTGLLAAGFLFIIISGALRVHKHPERYGLVPDWDRQRAQDGSGGNPSAYATRARGLARAVLDSIPLVRLQLPETHPVPDKEAEAAECRDELDKGGADAQSELDMTGAAVANAPAQNTVKVPSDGSRELDAEDTPSAGVDPEPVVMTEADAMDCSICFEAFEPGDILRVLPCNHRFHSLCVDPWLLNSSSQCPLCRVDLSLARDEQIPDQPPDEQHGGAATYGNNNNTTTTTTTTASTNGAGVVIPPSYDVDTSRFNRFLDMWNAQLLPREARRQALARFHEEAELRRTLRQRDEATNRSRWARFVGSRRLIHQLRLRRDQPSSNAPQDQQRNQTTNISPAGETPATDPATAPTVTPVRTPSTPLPAEQAAHTHATASQNAATSTDTTPDAPADSHASVWRVSEDSGEYHDTVEEHEPERR